MWTLQSIKRNLYDKLFFSYHFSFGRFRKNYIFLIILGKQTPSQKSCFVRITTVNLGVSTHTIILVCIFFYATGRFKIMKIWGTCVSIIKANYVSRIAEGYLLKLFGKSDFMSEFGLLPNQKKKCFLHFLLNISQNFYQTGSNFTRLCQAVRHTL